VLNKSCYYYDEIEGVSHCLVTKCRLINCAEPCKFFEMVTASPMFVNHMDKVYQNAQKITPIEGYDDVVIHGTSFYFINKNADGKENIVSVEEFAHVAKIHYNNNVPNIRLISCRSGILDNGTAQQLASLLGVDVLAPNGIAVIDFDGDIHITDVCTDEVLPSDIAWRLFKPKR